MNEPLGPIALVLLVIPAIALRLAVRALYGRSRLAAADPMQTLLSLTSTIMFVLAAIGVTAGYWILIVPLPVAVIVVALMVVDRARHAEHRALLGSLAAAAQRGVPLSESARAYGDETLGDTGVRALALAEAIERGEPLSRAVRTARLRMGAAMKLAVRLGESLGALAAAMRQTFNDTKRVDQALRGAIFRFFYLGLVLLTFATVSGFVMWKIVPVCQRMFDEFGMKLPAMTTLIIDFSTWYTDYGWWMTAPVTFVGPLFLLVGFLYYIGWFPRDLPLVWRLFRRYDGALVMRGLSLAISRGMPLPQAMRLVADCYPIRMVAGNLRSAAERVAAGIDWRLSLLETGLIGTADAAVLGAAERTGNLHWALSEMADSAIRRQTYLLQAVLQVLFPALLLAIGIVVGSFVVALFLPLVSLIEGLS